MQACHSSKLKGDAIPTTATGGALPLLSTSGSAPGREADGEGD